jgi:hypothetical protein
MVGSISGAQPVQQGAQQIAVGPAKHHHRRRHRAHPSTQAAAGVAALANGGPAATGDATKGAAQPGVPQGPGSRTDGPSGVRTGAGVQNSYVTGTSAQLAAAKPATAAPAGADSGATAVHGGTAGGGQQTATAEV